VANAVPQLPGLKRQGCEWLEEFVRAEACARRGRVFTGPIYATTGGTIGADALPIPVVFVKIAVDLTSGWTGFRRASVGLSFGKPLDFRKVHWVRPNLVCEVSYLS
jgi:DNA/RNA endonuclease G (NUC1)